MAFRKPKPLGPTVTYSDFTTSFARNAVSNDVIRLTDINAVKRSIKNLVVTKYYVTIVFTMAAVPDTGTVEFTLNRIR